VSVVTQLVSKVVTTEQATRFARLFAVTAVAQLVALNGNYTRDAVIAAAVGAAEVAFRAVFPTFTVGFLNPAKPTPPAAHLIAPTSPLVALQPPAAPGQVPTAP
jgi:hypothetical protein